jgi:hypothetical protein
MVIAEVHCNCGLLFAKNPNQDAFEISLYAVRTYYPLPRPRYFSGILRIREEFGVSSRCIKKQRVVQVVSESLLVVVSKILLLATFTNIVLAEPFLRQTIPGLLC